MGLLGLFPLPTSFGSGLQFVTLQLLFMNQLHFFGSIHEFHYTISTNFYLYLQYFQKRFSICDRFLSEVFFPTFHNILNCREILLLLYIVYDIDWFYYFFNLMILFHCILWEYKLEFLSSHFLLFNFLLSYEKKYTLLMLIVDSWAKEHKF